MWQGLVVSFIYGGCVFRVNMGRSRCSHERYEWCVFRVNAARTGTLDCLVALAAREGGAIPDPLDHQASLETP
jgi:hypothetical protein